MASPHSGSNVEKLVSITTEAFDITIKGKPVHPKYEKLRTSDAQSKMRITSKIPFQADVFHPSMDAEEKEEKQTYYGQYQIRPCFFEEQSYELIIEKNGFQEIDFWHESQLIRRQVQPVGNRGRLMTGILNFGSEIGYTELVILADQKETMKIKIEVFPSKLDYQDDYYSLLEDVNCEIHNLAFEFLKKTYQLASPNQYVGNSLAEYYHMLRLIFEKLMKSVDYVLQRPHHILHEEVEVVPFHKIKRSHGKTLRWIEKNSHYLERVKHQLIPQKALSVQKRISFDTYENRFVKFVATSVKRKIDAILRRYAAINREKDPLVIQLLSGMTKEVNQRLEFSVLREVGNLHTAQSLSLVLNMAPGYKDIYKYYLMLQKGLSVNGEIYQLSMKNVSELYEYWCFLKLNGLMVNRDYELIKQDCIKVDYSGLTVNLIKGVSSTVQYRVPATDERIRITYNPSNKSMPTVSQRPDSILSIEKNGSQNEYEYIFDAKYRINPAIEDTSYYRAYRNPGPEEEDINTMHRYRDAIVTKNRHSEDVFHHRMYGAYVLFPYREEQLYQQHRFYKSIEEVNIGGLPFLPGATNLVSGLIKDLVESSSDTAFDKAVLPIGVYDYLERIDFEDRNVLVGMLKSIEQFNKCMEENFYYIPKKLVADQRLNIKYIALYQSINLFNGNAGIRFTGEIEALKELPRHGIIELPSHSVEIYYYFKIKKWMELPNPIRIEGAGTRSNFYTNRRLLDVSEVVSELYCKSKEQFRGLRESERERRFGLIGNPDEQE
ncbi:restriction endonuclease-like protein [Anoxynatronum buryatiense]|uniref:DUF2357 domain-containing protein n=1 Tax=Anoxynatronum buryatiense TaxID=489973 RepID=A0AA45WYY6_9CLOT|nr:restriction endonuclease-like protein [Anoxynatronum buryatiense]SMP70904.1 hypothetical protein SAMN06296020_12137 [Anoxynatronum buryatiense]